MKRFSKKGHRTPHSTRSHHSGHNRSVSSLPTITEEGKKKRVPSMRMSSKSKATSDKLAAKDNKLGRRESKMEEEKGQVAEVGIADEEDSMESSDNQSSDSSEVGPPTMIERMPSRFFESGRIVEAADVDEFDEVSTPAFREESQPEDDPQA